MSSAMYRSDRKFRKDARFQGGYAAIRILPHPTSPGTHVAMEILRERLDGSGLTRESVQPVHKAIAEDFVATAKPYTNGKVSACPSSTAK